MGVTLVNSGIVWCSTFLVLNLVSSQNTWRLLLVICCVAATASAHPHERSLLMSTGFGTFSQKTLSIPTPWFRFPCNLVEWRIFEHNSDLWALIFLLCFAINSCTLHVYDTLTAHYCSSECLDLANFANSHLFHAFYFSFDPISTLFPCDYLYFLLNFTLMFLLNQLKLLLLARNTRSTEFQRHCLTIISLP